MITTIQIINKNDFNYNDKNPSQLREELIKKLAFLNIKFNHFEKYN